MTQMLKLTHTDLETYNVNIVSVQRDKYEEEM